MPLGYIYKIVFPHGKHYIGLTTTSLEQRTKEHKYRANSDNTLYLYNSLRKYDMVNTFELVEIDTADTKDELCEKEKGYIIEYNSYYMDGKGYNMTHGGEGVNGYVHTEEDNLKNSERRKQYYKDNPEVGKEYGEKMQQYYVDNPDARQKQSEHTKKQFGTPEARTEQSEKLKKYYEENPEAGKERGERIKKYYEENQEAREKISERMKQYYEENPEAGKKQSERKKKYYEKNPEEGKYHGQRMKKYYEENPESRKKASERVKLQYKNNPQLGKEHGERMKQYYEENPEARQKCSESQKNRFNNPREKEKILDAKGQNKPFDVFKKDGTLIQTFTYQFEAMEYLQEQYHITSRVKIGEVLAGRLKSSYGFVFKYKQN